MIWRARPAPRPDRNPRPVLTQGALSAPPAAPIPLAARRALVAACVNTRSSGSFLFGLAFETRSRVAAKPC
jgi:hypothetical protein